MPTSEYVRAAQLNWLRGTAMPTAPTTLYVSLHTADPGTTGASEIGAGVGYARVLATLTVPVTSGAAKLTDNTAALTFGPGTGAGFGTVTYFGVWSAATAGNFLWGGTATSRTIAAGDSYKFDVGQLDITLQ